MNMFFLLCQSTDIMMEMIVGIVFIPYFGVSLKILVGAHMDCIYAMIGILLKLPELIRNIVLRSDV